MSYVSPNPKFSSVSFPDIGSGSAANPAAGNFKIVNRFGKFFARDSSGNEVGLGSGTGALNAVLNPNDATGWASSGAGMTIATSDTSTDLPLDPIIPTSIKLTPVSGTDYARYRFVMPEALKNSKLSLSWFQLPLSGYTSGDVKVEVHTNTLSDYTGTDATLSLANSVSGVSGLANTTSRFETSFDSDASTYYELRLIRVSGTTAINLANVFVGSPDIANGAVVSDWQSYTPTIAGFGTATNVSFRYRRIGSSVQVAGFFTGGTVSGTQASVTLPTGLNADTTALPATNVSTVGSYAGGYGAAGLVVDPAAPSVIKFSNISNPNSLFAGNNQANTQPNTLNAIIPIAEWAGNGTLATGQNDVEYAFNTSTNTTTSDTTSFGYGPQGAITAAITSNVFRTVRFQTPIQPSDTLTLEVSSDRLVWKELNCWQLIGSNYVQNIALQNTLYYGAGIDTNTVSQNTDCRVNFGQYASTNGGSAYGGTGINWPASDLYWRVKKEKAGVAVGFGAASSTLRGLVYGSTENTSLTMANVSNLGTVSTAYQHFESFQLPSGVWKVKFYLSLLGNSVSASNIFEFSISTLTFKNGPEFNQPIGVNLSQSGPGQSQAIQAFTIPNSGTVRIYTTGTVVPNLYRWLLSGEVLLESKPSWA